MGSLFGSLLSAAGALRAYERALAVTQNNVANAQTPGYAKERLQLVARSFQPEYGLIGGVDAGRRISARDLFAERSVWLRSQSYGRSSQTASSLARIEPVLTVSAGAGIPNAINKLFESFSALSVAPNDTAARQAVLDRAAAVATSINYTARELTNARAETAQQAASVVTRINDLAARIHQLDLARRTSGHTDGDAGVDAQLYSLLEELSGLTDFTMMEGADGISIYLGGLTPLVMPSQPFALRTDTSTGSLRILDAQGKDLTDNIQGGTLSALVAVHNTNIPSYLNDLNRLAVALADSVNTTLANGLDQNGAPPAQDLFAYGSAADAALTLTVNPLTPAEIAGASTTAPGSNGNALALAALGTSPQATLDNLTFTGFYGEIAAQLGRDLSGARESETTEELLLTQAQLMRASISGVSLDEEAARIIEFQAAYEAAAQMVTVLNEMTDTIINMVR